jgi:hypothetical protein
MKWLCPATTAGGCFSCGLQLRAFVHAFPHDHCGVSTLVEAGFPLFGGGYGGMASEPFVSALANLPGDGRRGDLSFHALLSVLVIKFFFLALAFFFFGVAGGASGATTAVASGKLRRRRFCFFIIRRFPPAWRLSNNALVGWWYRSEFPA